MGKERLLRLALTALLLAALAEFSLCISGSIPACKLSSLLGEEALYMLLGVLIYTLGSGGFGIRLVSSLALTAAATVLLKVTLNLPRPPREEWLASASGPGFPSGHTAVTTAFWLLLALYTRNSLVAGVAVLHTASVAASRVVLHVHYLRDIVGGAILAITINAPLYVAWRKVDSIVYTLCTASAASVLSAAAVAVNPSYASAWHVLGISAGLAVAAATLLPSRLRVVSVLETRRPHTERLIALAYSGLWLAMVFAARGAGEHLAGLAYALFAMNTAYSRPLAALLKRKLQGR